MRPGYPEQALETVPARRPHRVADLGAGTGKLTVALAAPAPVVIAVEPDPARRAVLSAPCPTVSVRAGSAEALPLGDREVNVITLGQAWHRVDAERAVPQAHRALRSDGI